MTEIETAMIAALMFIQGFGIGYIIWAPTTLFKQGLIDGLTLKFLWSRK